MRDSISAAATTRRYIDKFCSNRNHTLPDLTSSDYLNLEEGRSALRQVRLLGEPGLRQVDGLFQIEWSGFSRHKPRCSQEKDTNSLLRAESKPVRRRF